MKRTREQNINRREIGLFSAEEKSDTEFLCDLAERLMRIPVMYGTDQGDIDRLNEIARKLER